jgi:hypothetical protein
LNWYSGVKRIPRPAELEAEKSIETGAVVMGDQGTIVYGSHGAGQVRLVPQAKADKYRKPLKTLPRVKGHHQDWLNAIRTGGRAGSDFAYGGPLTEIAMLGVIAIKLAGQKLEWNGKAGRFRNSDDANLFLNPPYREGWSLQVQQNT